MLSIIKDTEENMEKVDFLLFDFPRWNGGLANEYKVLYDKIYDSLSLKLFEGKMEAHVLAYTALEIDFPIKDFLLVYLYTLHRFILKNKDFDITMHCHDDVRYSLYASTYGALLQNHDLYNKGVISLFDNKVITVTEDISFIERVILMFKKNSNVMKKIIDRAGEKEVKRINKRNYPKTAIYMPYGKNINNTSKNIIISGQNSSINRIEANRITIDYIPICYY